MIERIGTGRYSNGMEESMEKMTGMDITQSFYNNMASHYDKLFLDWKTTTHEQAVFLSEIFRENGFDYTSKNS